MPNRTSSSSGSNGSGAAELARVVVIGDGHIGRHVAAELAPHVNLLGLVATRYTSPIPSRTSSPSPVTHSFAAPHFHPPLVR